MPLAQLSEAIDGLIAEGPDAWCDGESMVALRREMARLDAVMAQATARFDASGQWRQDRAQTAAAWLAWKCGLPRSVARGQLSVARTLRHLPVCEQAWLDGAITADHVRAFGAVRRAETQQALARDEEMLVEHATHQRFEGFTRILGYWAQRADPDGAENDDADRRHQREVYLSESFRGMWFGKITLDPISGTIVATELGRREKAMFDADWAEAKARLGREPTIADLARTPAQRRADALVEMATRSAAMAPGARRPDPLFSVYVGWETLHGPICELASGTVVSPGALIPWLDKAYIERAVFGLDGRVEISERARLFKGATRRAVQLRDRQCDEQCCDVPAEHCDVDHIVPYSQGGLTTQDNGRPGCGFHNRLWYNNGP